ncbi:hypothetical protein BCR42DRAFT_406486 [Absidia repens]|uniref:Major facilitator superfamily associated domain-containing protein n=1 Tax=Absidia repens TaxID=90262 RepID=A0A1X2IWH7_9FUNG|nr:hypothetical protein BCR42DRAFT_406486 [Absidia repens]
MLFWSKFLSIAHGVAFSVHVFLPLYFFHLHHLTYFGIAILLSIALITQTVASGFWTAWVDQRKPMLHGVLTSLLTGLGAASLVLLLSVPPDTWLSWPAAILCMILDGWFFQPLGCLVDSAIIKILGDYKLFYESERRWGKLSLGITALGIGCFLDDDHDFDTLMGTVVTGCAALFLLSLSTNVQPADPLLLDLQIGDPLMETTPLHSNPSILPHYYTDSTSNPHHYHKHYTHHFRNQQQPPSIKYQQSYHQYYETTNSDLNNEPATTSLLDSANSSPSPYYYATYKPYSIFGGHLSHISEEDDSMLQRIPSTPPHAPSIQSNKTDDADQLLDSGNFHVSEPSYYASPPPTPLPSSSFTDHRVSSTICTSSTESSQLSSPSLSSHHMINSVEGVYPNSSNSSMDSINSNHSPITSNDPMATSSSLNQKFMSMSLALLPFPPGEIPMIILITVFPRFRPASFYHHQHHSPPQKEQHEPHHHLLPGHENHYLYRDNNDNDNEPPPWHVLIQSSCFVLGLVYAPMILFAPLIYDDYFGLPMHTIGLMVLTGCLSDIGVTNWAPSMLERFSLRSCVLLAHLMLVVCIFTYAWMPFEKDQSLWLSISFLVLHSGQSSCIRIIWLMASYQVDFLFLSQCQERMMLRGRMSALYSAFGPAIGSVTLGWLVASDWSIQSIYYFILLLIPISASLTLGWC